MNKREKQLMNTAKEQQRFSIRKLSIGAASVLLGTVFYLGTNESTVNAAQIKNGG